MELANASGGKVTLNDAVFGADFNESLVHQAVTAYQAGGRAGTVKQKNRSDVRGGGIKPWNQKGSGRARAGTSRSPIWRSGGVTFAARPRSYKQKLNQKMYRAAMRSIFSELARQERLVVSGISLSEPKTKALAGELKGLSAENALIVVTETDKNLELASRNLPHAECVDVKSVNPVNLLRHDKVILSPEALQKVEEWLA